MNWQVIGDSVEGTSHRTRNTPCQDEARYRVFGSAGEWLVVAVADGAGSSSYPEVGARIVCDELVKRVTERSTGEQFTRDWAVELLTAVRSTVLAEAEQREIRPRELASTALLAVVGPNGAAFAQLGDGAIVFGEGTSYKTAFWPEPTEYANTTNFLTDERFVDAVLFTTIDTPVIELAVLSDGLQRLALDFTARKPHAPFFRPLFRDLRATSNLETLSGPFRAFLDSPNVNAKTDDDKTLVLAVQRP